jgi:CheY-like chemotaxis protein
MARYRALIVDDSKSARQSLAKLLERHDLAVEFAESGEAALDFLKTQLVDVIFMDHTMPGMNGLEAVTAIKGNPRTATIPVMMYTTKEGEVYVGQARALGAIGVLPKQVQPGVLFDMLCQLDLVVDRRDVNRPPEADAPRRRFDEMLDDVDREYDQRALGASVQALITRILEEQYAQLRSDVQSSQRRFARQVATEILEQRPSAMVGSGASGASAFDPDRLAAGTRPMPRPHRGPLRAVAAALVLLSLTLGFTSWQLRADRDAAVAEIAQLRSESRHEVATLSELSGGLAADLNGQRAKAAAHRVAAAHAFEWAMNQNAQVRPDEPPFNEQMAARLPELLGHLDAMGFRGAVVLTARLGQFCLARDEYGDWQPAADEVPVSACEFVGHPLDGAGSLAALQTVGFADTWKKAASAHPDLSLELRAVSASESPGGWNPGSFTRAIDWNTAASRDNTVEMTLVPDRPEHLQAGVALRR